MSDAKLEAIRRLLVENEMRLADVVELLKRKEFPDGMKRPQAFEKKCVDECGCIDLVIEAAMKEHWKCRLGIHGWTR